MRSRNHIVISIIISLIIYSVFRDFKIAVANLIAGVLIDVDHIPDYMYTKGKIYFDVKDFFNMCDELRLKKLFLVIHSYELLLSAIVIAFFYKNAFYLGLVIGYTQHFIFDIFFNGVYIKGYSFIFRLNKNFSSPEIIKNLKI